MDVSPFPFEPVPLRSRGDGWTPERKRNFIALIAEGLRPGAAPRRVGMRRQGAYALRERPGGEGFAAAWDSAAAHARQGAAGPPRVGLYDRAVEGVAVPIRYRGRVTAIDRRVDNAALVRLFGMLDRSFKNDDGRGGYFVPWDAELLSAFGGWRIPAASPSA